VSERFNTLHVGDLAPWFRQACIGQDVAFNMDMAAGRFVVVCFHGSADDPLAGAALAALAARPGLFDGARRLCLGITDQPADAERPDLAPSDGVRHLLDAEGEVSRLFGVVPATGLGDPGAQRRGWFVLDPRLRVIARFPLGPAGDAAALDFVERLPSPGRYLGEALAPVLIIPDVFEPDFAQRLIAYHRQNGGEDSAVLTERAAFTDHDLKSRRDRRITDKALADQAQTRIFRRVAPELRHAFQFEATRMERLIVACYAAEEGGRFKPHRDNTVAATAHRRFAVSINLNDDFEGGALRFAEYSARPYAPPAGGALVFSCALMHEVLPITRGRRYACLPFVYDEAGARLRRGGPDKAP
jgi:predicted 2-oxoglutarate/Fe(II)-dependent dioxygenase YbiX